MVQKDIKYDPKADLQKVEQVGFIDLVKANESGSIPAAVDVDQLQFNEIEDPNSIGYRPKDVFEQMQANKQIVGYKPPKKDVEN